MVSGRIQVEELVVKRVRQPGETMPIRGVKRGERPLHGVPVKAGLNLEVADHIIAVIEGDERIAFHGMVKRHRGDDEQKSESKPPLFRQRLRALPWPNLELGA